MTSPRTLTCKELTEVLTDYLEGVMPLKDRARFEAHLAICDGCVTYVDQMRQVIATVHELRADDVEATAPGRCSTPTRCW